MEVQRMEKRTDNGALGTGRESGPGRGLKKGACAGQSVRVSEEKGRTSQCQMRSAGFGVTQEENSVWLWQPPRTCSWKAFWWERVGNH